MAGLGVGLGGPGGPKNDADCKTLLHTSIHNYFMHEGFPKLAEAIRSSSLSVHPEKLMKAGQTQMSNGLDDGMDGDSKDDVKNRSTQPGETLLLDYWFIFWDMWRASKDRTAKNDGSAQQYIMQQQRARMGAQQAMMSQGMMQQFANGFGRGGPNGVNLGRTAMANNGRNVSMNPQFNRAQAGIGQHQMQRDGSDMDLNGQQQTGSPLSADNARSPKRQRVEGGFNGQPLAGAMRGPMGGPLPNGAVGNQEAMMMQNTYNPKTMSPTSFSAFITSNKQGYSSGLVEHHQRSVPMNGLQNGFPNAMQMSPSMGADFDMNMMANGQAAMRQNGAGSGGALADYQMQLMLLEQQNKKRLMMARQEQDVHGNTGPMLSGPGGFPQGNSPHNRGSPSNDTKRNTPKPGQGSPMPDGGMPHNRGSPAPGAFDGNPMGQMGGQFMPQMKNMMSEGIIGPNGQLVRAPSSHPMGAQPINATRIPNAQWTGASMPNPMMGQAPGGQPNPPGDNQLGQPPNQQRGNMPPPQAPGGNNKAQSSPTVQNDQPPTPSTTNKAPPKARKDTKDKKKATKKATGNTNATPNPENERLPSPTPQTPIITNHPDAASIKGQPGNAPGQNQGQNQGHDQNGQVQQQPGQANAGQQSMPQHNNAQLAQGMQGGNNMNDAPFGGELFPADFISMDSMDDTSTILDGFDFDAFISGEPIGWANDDFQMPGDNGLGAETGQ